MLMLLIAFLACVLLFVAAPILIKTRLPKKQADELLRLSETSFTAVLGLMLIALAFFLLYAKYSNSALAGTDTNSYLFVAGFAILCSGSGSGILLYTFLKRIIVCEDRVMAVSLFGKIESLQWKGIIEVKASLLSRSVTLIGSDAQLKVSGEPKAYKKFLEIAKKKIHRAAGSDVLEKQSERFLF